MAPKKQEVDQLGRLYLRRWFLSRYGASVQVFLHELHQSDELPDPHDHPWDYTTILVRGGYIELERLGVPLIFDVPGQMLSRCAEDAHRLKLVESPTLTLIVTEPPRRDWGYHTPHGWIDAPTYLAQKHKEGCGG